uniref:Nuclear receptor corepressor 2 n=1 Tax=Phallusia mammillata TaxID=59560 RepID=A0A6F9DMM2_9ASCI|nr:nuclear receptor corepressor 2 [Phallusia mammillata]
MKQPWQTTRPQQYSTSRADEHLSQRSSNVRHPAPPIVSTPLMVPYIPQHGAIPQPYLAMHFDPRPNTSLIPGGLPRPQIPMVPSMQQSSSHASSSYQAKRPSTHRVSLLQDIRISGERDRDGLGSVTSGSSSDAHALGFSYGINAPPRRMSLPASQGSLPRPVERPSGSAHSPYTQHVPSHNQLPKDHQSHPRHSVGSAPQAIPVLQTHPEIKKEAPVTVKQELGSKLPQHHSGSAEPSTAQPQSSSLMRQSSVSSVKSDHSSLHGPNVVEQKSKEDLVQAMDKVDREISKVETEITRLQKKKTHLEESAMKPPEPEKAELSPQRVEPKHRDLWQVIYSENRKKAEAAKAVLDGLCKKYEMPLYNQPSDTDVYQKNLEKNEEMRPKLLTYFQNRMKLQNIRERYLCTRYDQLMDTWQQKSEEIESNPKRKAKEAKSRDFFEKLFPEVRKQREQQERIDRVGTRGDTCRSEADLAEIVDGLNEQENQLQHMRQLAVVPPMLLDTEQRRIQFINNNGFIGEPFKEFKESQQLDAWSDQEKAIFKDKFVQHPKSFHHIASFIEKKSVADCILYYYLTKKTNNYKSLVRKQTLKPKKLKSGKHHANFAPQPNSAKDSVDKTNKDDIKKESENEPEEVRIDKPPSPRMTRARKQTMNWTEDEITLVKEGFAKHGRDFSAVARMVPNKTEQKVKNFYHNYKKKHGLDQLISESKRKKTSEARRTRHHAQSPDIPATDEDDRKNTESPMVEEKVKTEKSDDLAIGDDKKQKPKDRTPSPAVSNSGKTPSASEGTDPVSLSTTHIRTRRTAALAAAVTSQQDSSEATGSKRPNSSKSPALSQGEPAEKKQKKHERKNRREKTTSESSSKDTPKTGASKDEVKLDAPQNTEPQSANENEKLSTESPSAKPANKSEIRAPAQDLKKSDAPSDHDSSKDHSQVASTTIPSVARQPISLQQSEDHDSSATCSADEDANSEGHSWKGKSKLQGPQDAFDLDFNDSPVINLDKARHSLTGATTVVTSMSPAVTGATNVQPVVLNMPGKPLLEIPTSMTLNRPQSLPPPGVMVPPPVTGVRATAHAAPAKHGTIITSVADNSRPSSTPAGADLTRVNPYQQVIKIQTAPGSSKDQPSYIVHPSSTSAGTVLQRHVVHTTVIDDIRNLTYQPGKISVPLVTVSSSGKTFTVPMPGVMDLTAPKTTATSQSSAQNTARTASASQPASSQHPLSHASTITIAGSMQKDFRPSVVTIPDTKHTIPELSSTYQRTYSSSDIRSMQDKSAVIPAAPTSVAVPVSALRFASTRGSVPQSQFRQSPAASTAIQQILAVKPGDIKHSGKDDKIPPGLGGVLQGPHRTAPRPQFGSITTGTPVVQPTLASSLAPTPTIPGAISSLAYRVSSSNRMPVVTPATNLVSIRSGKPVTKNPLLHPTDGHEKPAPKPATAPSQIRHLIPQTVQMSTLGGQVPGRPQFIDVASPAKGAPHLPHGVILPGQQAQNFWGLHPGRLPPQALSQSPIVAPVKSEKPLESSTQSAQKQAKLEEVARAEAYRYYFQHGAPLPEMSTKRKISDEPSPSSKQVQHVVQRSATPPQMKLSERKAPSRGPAPGKAEHIPRYPSPMQQQQQPPQEKQHKEEVKRPDSTSRYTPDRKSVVESPLSAGQRSMSAHSLASTPRSLPDQRTAAELLATQVQGLDPLMLAQMQLRYPFLKPTDGNLNQIMQQYMFHPFAGFIPPSAHVRSFSPSGNENLESSRHNMLSHDYATSLQMRHNSSAVSAAAAARGSPFPTASQATSGAPPVMVTSALSSVHPLMVPHHPGSPGSDRLTFIPQIPSSLPTTHSTHHTRTVSNPVRNTPSKSPSSPHRSSTPHHAAKPPYPSPGPQLYPHIPEMYHPGVERRKSSSPHRTPSTDHHTPITQSALANQIAAHEARRTPPAPYGTPPPPRQPQSADRNIPGSPHMTQRSSSSPHLPQGRVIKRDPVQEQHRVSDREIRASDLHSGQPIQGDRFRSALVPPPQATPQQRLVQEGIGQFPQEHRRKESSEGSEKNLAGASTDRHGRHVQTDLRSKGRTKMTTAHLINAIIDHNIREEYDVAQPPTVSRPHDPNPTHQRQFTGQQRLEMEYRQAQQQPPASRGQPEPPITHPQQQPSIAHPQQPHITHPQQTPMTTLPQISHHQQPLMSHTQQAPMTRPLQIPMSHPQQQPPTTTHPQPTGLDYIQETSHGIISDMIRKDARDARETREANEKKAMEQRHQEVMKAQAMAARTGAFPSSETVEQAAGKLAMQNISRSTMLMQHPLAPQACQNPGTPLETLIRTALLSEGSSRGGSPAPQESVDRSPRLDSNSSRSSPIVHAPVLSPSSRNKSAEPKRAETPQYNTTASGSGGGPAPMYISALAFRAGQQGTTSNQSIPPASNLPQRPSVVTGPTGVHQPHMSPYHPPNPQQAPQPVVERPPPMATTQYEPLSDSD